MPEAVPPPSAGMLAAPAASTAEQSALPASPDRCEQVRLTKAPTTAAACDAEPGYQRSRGACQVVSAGKLLSSAQHEHHLATHLANCEVQSEDLCVHLSQHALKLLDGVPLKPALSASAEPRPVSQRRQPQPLATPNRSTDAHRDRTRCSEPVSPALSEEDAALRIQSRARGNAERAAFDREKLSASAWCGMFFDQVDVDGLGVIGKTELILASESFGDNVHKATARVSEILAAAPESLATAAGFVDRKTFVSYWVDATRDSQSSSGCYSLGYASNLHDQLFALKAKLFEAARFVDADLCQDLDAMDEETAEAIRVQKVARPCWSQRVDAST